MTWHTIESCGCCPPTGCSCSVCDATPPAQVEVSITNLNPSGAPYTQLECCGPRIIELNCVPASACTWTGTQLTFCPSPCGADNPLPDLVSFTIVDVDDVAGGAPPGNQCQEYNDTWTNVKLERRACSPDAVCDHFEAISGHNFDGIKVVITASEIIINFDDECFGSPPGGLHGYMSIPHTGDCRTPDPMEDWAWTAHPSGCTPTIITWCCDGTNADVTSFSTSGDSSCAESADLEYEWKLVGTTPVTGELTITNPDTGNGEKFTVNLGNSPIDCNWNDETLTHDSAINSGLPECDWDLATIKINYIP